MPESPSSHDERLTRPREWWHRYLSPEDRRRVMRDLAITTPEAWTLRFGIMLTLALVVAAMGLIANSAAVVIGAMLLAPLMTPVLGTAASLAMGLPKKAAVSFIRVVVATVGCILLAYVLAMLFQTGELSDEVLSRTAPDIKDLVVALAAGVAGSYATVRTDASSALPGVAVAVALVPPLAVVGITWQQDLLSLSVGALLLYTTNLAAIILAGVIVFVVTGFVPPRRLATTTPRIIVATLLSVGIVIALALPLVRASNSAAESSNEQQRIITTIDNWMTGLALERTSYHWGDGVLSVDVTGPDAPPDDSELRERLAPILGNDYVLDVQWIRTQRATTTTTAAPTTTTIDDQTLMMNQIQMITAVWLGEVKGADSEVQSVFFDESTGGVRIAATGSGEPPSAQDRESLRDELEAIGFGGGFRLNWTTRQSLSDGTVPPTPDEVRQQAMIDYLSVVLPEQGATLSSLDFDGQTVAVEIAGVNEPDATSITEQLRVLSGREDTIVRLVFDQRTILTTTTTQSVTTSTSP